MKSFLLSCVLILAPLTLYAGSTSTEIDITVTGSVATFPLAVSNNTLVTAGGQPYMIAGDSPQAAIILHPCSAGTPTLANCTGSADTVPTNATWVAYVKDRAANGLNSLWFNVICEAYTACDDRGFTYDGLQPFGSQLPSGSKYIGAGNALISCPEGTINDVHCYDMSTAGAGASAAYWTRIDELIALAGQQGLQIIMNVIPNDTSGGPTACPSQNNSWQAAMMNNYIAAGGASTKITAYGQFLANRYKNTANIMWVLGNDYACWNQTSSHNNVKYDIPQYALAAAIHNQEVANAGSGGIVHVIATEVDAGVSSLDNTQDNWASLVNFNGIYHSFTVNKAIPYDLTLHAFPQKNSISRPFIVESFYQGEDDGESSPNLPNCNAIDGNPGACALRQRNLYWWSTLSSAVWGFLDGNTFVWKFATGWNTTGAGCTGGGSTPCLDTPATKQLGYMAKFFMQYPSWQTLIPDVTQGGTPIASPFVTSGRGTYLSAGTGFPGNNWVASGAASDGSAAWAYVPGTNGTSVTGRVLVTVNTAKIGPSAGANATISWYDPTKDPSLASSYVNSSGAQGTLCSPTTTPCANNTTQSFTTPSGTHTDGYADWVLVATAFSG